MGTSVMRYLGSSLLWNSLLAVLPMTLLVIFIFIINEQSWDEERLRTETTLSHSTAAMTKNLETFFAVKLKYFGAMKSLIENGVWTDHTDVETFTHYALPAMNSHEGFRAIMCHQNDGSFIAAIRERNAAGGSMPADGLNIVVMQNTLGHATENIQISEEPSKPQVRRFVMPLHDAFSANNRSSYFNKWQYLSTLPSDVKPEMPTHQVILGSNLSWYSSLADSKEGWTLDIDADTKQFYYANRIMVSESKRGLDEPITYSTRVAMRPNAISDLFRAAGEQGYDFALLRISDCSVLLDTRNNTFPYSTPAGTTLSVNDTLWGRACQEVVPGSGQKWIQQGFNLMVRNNRDVSGRVVNQGPEGDDPSDYALLMAGDSATTSQITVMHMFEAQYANIKRLLVKLANVGKGTKKMFLSRTVADLADPGQTTRLLVPFFFGIESFADELMVCQGNSSVPVLGNMVQLVHPCYQVKRRVPGTLDVTFWAGNISNIGRVYNFIKTNAVNDWYYSAYTKTSDVLAQTTQALQQSTTKPMEYIYPRLEPPFMFEGSLVMAMPGCIFWPNGPHGSTFELWSCIRFVFDVNELKNILIDADLDKNYVAGQAAIVYGDGTIITSTVEKWRSGANIMDPAFQFAGLRSAQFQYLKDHPGSKVMVDPTSKDYMTVLKVFDETGPSTPLDGIYLFVNLPMLVGEVEEDLRYTKYEVDGLVVLAVFIFALHLTHFFLGYRSLRLVRGALLKAANLSISPSEQRELRMQRCCSNTDLDSLMDHAFFTLDTINHHKSFLDSNVRSTLRNEQNPEQKLIDETAPVVSHKAKRELNAVVKERPVVFLACYFPNLDAVQRAGVKALPQMQELKGTDAKWYRIAPVTSGAHNTAMFAAAYWLPEDGPNEREGTAEAQCLRKAWNLGSSWVKLLESTKVKDCVITLSAGRSFAGNLGPVQPDGAWPTKFYKQFVINGFCKQHSQSLFAMVLNQQQEVIRTGGSNPTCTLVTDQDHARTVGASNTTSLSLRKEKIGELVLWVPEEQTPLTRGPGGASFTADGI